MMKFEPKWELNHNKNVRYCKFLLNLNRRSTFIGMIQSTFTLWRQRFSNVRPKIYSGIAIKSSFLGVTWPGSNQLKGMVLGEKTTIKKSTVYLVIASSNLLDCTRHIRYFTLVWFDQTPGRKPAWLALFVGKGRSYRGNRYWSPARGEAARRMGLKSASPLVCVDFVCTFR